MSALPADVPVLGSTLPRIWTPPLIQGPPGPCGCGCALTPQSSYGFDVDDFARDVLGQPLDPWQRWLVIHAGELLPDGRPRFRQVLVLISRQQGKALDCGVEVLTTSGWSTMGELQVGDEVFHPDGHPVRVTEAHPVMHGRPCYRVTTTDGRSIVADGEHLWTVQDRRRAISRGPRGNVVRSYAWETLTTEQLIERGLTRATRTNAGGGTSTDYAFRLPRQHAITSKPADLPLDPYLLGAWLGDGGSRQSALTVGDRDLDETLALIEAAGAEIVSRKRGRTAWHVHFRLAGGPMRSGFGHRCRELGVWGAKHIPDTYLTAGTEQRLALLQGLMDTDGSIYSTTSGSATAEYCTTNHDLAAGVAYLVRSLGWRAQIRESAAKLDGVEVCRRWRVRWTPQQGDPAPFRLRRKADRVQAPNARSGERHAVSIASIEPVESRPVRCIRVERPDGQFLAGRDLVATHNTHLGKVLTLYWLFVERQPLILGTSTVRDTAKESWRAAVTTAETCEHLTPELGGVRAANGEETLSTVHGCRYRIAASNRRGGRGMTINRLILDELREHLTYEAWDAAVPATNAIPDAQIWALTNQGGEDSVVLHSLHAAAAAYITTGVGDRRLGLFEWSAPPGADPTDIHALAQANPSLGRRTDADALLGMAIRAKNAGGAELASFRTEIMCQKVDQLDPAIDPDAWASCGTDQPTDLSAHRRNVALCVDVALDGSHATLAAAASLDGAVHVEIVHHWEGRGCTGALRESLPAIVARVKPGAVGWFPTGPAAAVAAELAERKGGAWPPPYVKVEEIRGSLTAVCMGLAELATTRQLRHPHDDLLNAHVRAAQKTRRGDGWIFGRQDSGGPIDATYAVAGAAHLARTMAVRPRPKIVTRRPREANLRPV